MAKTYVKQNDESATVSATPPTVYVTHEFALWHVLLSFAQFEREIISERTRDKIAAARRKGKWVGGKPLLGYDVQGSKLVVNEEEAVRVRAIFELYLTHQGLIPVVQELEKRDWLTKRWQTRKGHFRGGQRFTKSSLHHLLTNPVYLGKVKYKKEVHAGEHQAIIPPDVWQQVQELLRQKGPGTTARTESHALLKGILRCRPCGFAMTPTFAAKKGGCIDAAGLSRKTRTFRNELSARVLTQNCPISKPIFQLPDRDSN